MKNLYTLTIIIVVSLISACTFTEKIKDGTSAYERKQFAVAIPMLKSEYNKAKDRKSKGQLAMMLGDAYQKTQKAETSIDWYKKAYDNQFGPDALKAYAFALKKNGQYDEAKAAFKELGIEIGSPYEFRREIQACDLAKTWENEDQSKEYRIQAASFNSKFSDYSPVVLPKNIIVFTSDRKEDSEAPNYNWTGNGFSDLYQTNTDTKETSLFHKNINSPNNEGTIVFNKDFTIAYLSRCYANNEREDQYCKLMFSEKEGDRWSIPQDLPFLVEKVNYGHPALSSDGKTLYFSANHPDGWGGYDIYTVEKQGDEWSDPKLLGRSINTQGNEVFPTIHNDTLYFSSDYIAGMGGLDIFKTYRLEANKWSAAHNLKAPINSSGDDFGLVVNPYAKNENILQSGYFSSNRKEGKGGDDIYTFEKIVVPPAPEPEVKDTTPQDIVEQVITHKILLDIFVVEKIYQDPNNPNSMVLGRRPIDQAKINFNGQSLGSNTEGLVQIELSDSTDYSFFAQKAEYLSKSASFSTKGIGKDKNNPIQKFELEIVLDKIFKNQEITLDNIYYDYNASSIRSDAEPTLNELAKMLDQNPNVKIQLSSHTDCRGKNAYNEKLSQERAQSAVNYLISKGIAPNRLTAKGYGENAPAIECNCSQCTEEEHQANRRTTFKVID